MFQQVLARPSPAAALLAAAIAAPAAAQPSFRSLGLPPGDPPPPGFHASVWPEAVSADGSIVVGFTFRTVPWDSDAFRWTAKDGIVLLTDPTPEGGSQAFGISADGAAIVGDDAYVIISCGFASNYVPLSDAFRWEGEEGGVTTNLGRLAGDNTATAHDASADGSTVVGVSQRTYTSHRFCVSDDRAFRWTEDDGLVFLGIIGDACCSGSAAEAVSDDGAVVVGWSASPAEGREEAFRWTAETGMVGLGYMVEPNPNATSMAHGISGDGAVIVGEAASPEGFVPFRWTAEAGMTSLGDLPGATARGFALDASSDGAVIVGYSDTNLLGGPAFIWDTQYGMRQLFAVLTQDFALDLDGWTLAYATGISADGLVIVGWGINPDGRTRGWIADLRTPACAADWNGDDSLNSDDYFAFLASYFAGKADFNADGDVNSDDYFAFLTAFFNGC